MTFDELIKRLGLPAPERELEFHPDRAWRFDYAWPDKKVALEVEGGTWTGGRHINPNGYLKDLEKYNAAAVLGWRLLRVTPKSLVSLGTAELIKQALR